MWITVRLIHVHPPLPFVLSSHWGRHVCVRQDTMAPSASMTLTTVILTHVRTMESVMMPLMTILVTVCLAGQVTKTTFTHLLVSICNEHAPLKVKLNHLQFFLIKPLINIININFVSTLIPWPHLIPVGKDCDVDIDECSDPAYPCMALGTDTSSGSGCNNLLATYTCLCLPGYTGQDCGVGHVQSFPWDSLSVKIFRNLTTLFFVWQTEIDECTSFPCLHGGACDDEIGIYSCTCTDGWTGPTCDTVVDNCDSAPCQNGGTCDNSFDDYFCTYVNLERLLQLLLHVKYSLCIPNSILS